MVCYIKLNIDDEVPVATPATVDTTKNNAVNIVLSGTDKETALTALKAKVVTLPDPALGTLKHKDGTLVKAGDIIPTSASRTVQFVPVAYTCCTPVSFTFVILDSINQQSPPATLSINVLNRNTAPIIYYPASVTVERNYAYGIPLRVRDYDVADTETFVILGYEAGAGSFADASGKAFTKSTFNLTTVKVGSNGEATVFVFYTAPKDHASANYAQLRFVVIDAAGAESETGIIDISIKTTNKAPVTTPVDPITVIEKQASVEFSLYGVDEDNGDANTLTVVIVSLPQKGTLVQIGVGNVTGPTPIVISHPAPHKFYYQASHLNLEDSLSFYVMDNMESKGNTEQVSIYVTPVNDAPEASMVPNPTTTDEDTEVEIIFDTFDLDGDRVYIILDSLPTGTLYQSNGVEIKSAPAELSETNKFRYIPPKDKNGVPFTSFTFHADDKNALDNKSPQYTGVINVNAVNDAPTAEDESIEMQENDDARLISLSLDDIDSETLSAIIVTLPSASLGSLQDLSGNALKIGQYISEPFEVQFKPNPYSHGFATFSFYAFDGYLNSTSAAVISITVHHVNHKPVVSGESSVTTVQSVPVEIHFTLLEHDVGDVVSITFDTLEPGVDGAFSVDAVPATILSNGTYESFTVIYTPPIAKYGEEYARITVTVSDQDSLTSSWTVVVNVGERGNANPVADELQITATQDFTTPSFQLSGSDTDPIDANALVFVITVLPSGALFSNGMLVDDTPFIVDSTNNNLTYLTYGRAADSITFHAVDTVGATSSDAFVTITVIPTNHNPTLVVSSSEVTVNEDESVVIDVLSAEDPDEGDEVSVWIVKLPAKGTLKVKLQQSCNMFIYLRLCRSMECLFLNPQKLLERWNTSLQRMNLVLHMPISLQLHVTIRVVNQRFL